MDLHQHQQQCSMILLNFNLFLQNHNKLNVKLNRIFVYSFKTLTFLTIGIAPLVENGCNFNED